MDKGDKAVDMEHIKKLTRQHDDWKNLADDNEENFKNYYIANKCTWIPDTSKVTDIKKGVFNGQLDWKYSHHYKLD